MRVLDIYGNEITPDETQGYTRAEIIVIAHHDAVEAVREQYHYEVVKTYPNGGKDVKRVVDVPGVEAQDAWDETETILRFVAYTEEELSERRAEEEARLEAERLDAEAAEAIERENAKLKAQVAALTENLAFLEDCIVEMAEIVYA